jgi:hypothetical protein
VAGKPLVYYRTTRTEDARLVEKPTDGVVVSVPRARSSPSCGLRRDRRVLDPLADGAQRACRSGA